MIELLGGYEFKMVLMIIAVVLAALIINLPWILILGSVILMAIDSIFRGVPQIRSNRSSDELRASIKSYARAEEALVRDYQRTYTKYHR